MKGISVIIPMYNREKYIEECIRSVQKQTLQDLEIVCVDDGSTDNTIDIVKNLQKKDKRVRLIRINHSGAGYARNKGIELAEGEYVSFLDSDDYYMDEDALEKLLSTAIRLSENVCGSICCMCYDNRIELTNSARYYNELPAGGKQFSYKDIQCFEGYTGFIYKRSFLMDNDIFFPGYPRFEDPIFLTKALHCANTYFMLPVKLYGIRQGHHSLSHYTEYGLYELFGCRELVSFAYKKGYSVLCDRCMEYIIQQFRLINNPLTAEKMRVICDIDDICSREVRCKTRLFTTIGKWIETGYSLDRKNVVPERLKIFHDKVENSPEILKVYFDEHKISKVVIYGLGAYGNCLFTWLKHCHIEIVAGIDSKVEEFNELRVLKPTDLVPECDAVIIATKYVQGIKESLSYKTKVPVIYIQDMINEIEVKV